MAQDQDKKKLHSDEGQERPSPKVDSGDVPGRHRSAGEFGTHGGPNKPRKEDKGQVGGRPPR